MNNQDVLDSDFEQTQSSPSTGYKFSIQWWESRRLNYNKIIAIVGIVAFILMTLHLRSHPNSISFQSLPMISLFFGVSLLLFITYNLCFTLGWVLEFALSFFFNYNFSPRLRLTLYRLGILLSCLPIILLLILFVSLV